MQYKLSYLMSSSLTGKNAFLVAEDSQEVAIEPLDLQVTLNLQLKQYANNKNKSSHKDVKMSMTKDKFLQLTRDLEEAVHTMETIKQTSGGVF